MKLVASWSKKCEKFFKLLIFPILIWFSAFLEEKINMFKTLVPRAVFEKEDELLLFAVSTQEAPFPDD